MIVRTTTIDSGLSDLRPEFRIPARSVVVVPAPREIVEFPRFFQGFEGFDASFERSPAAARELR
jgi:hypothetical protein